MTLLRADSKLEIEVTFVEIKTAEKQYKENCMDCK
jgi:hypothetical protein